MSRVLLVEDDITMQTLIKEYLDGFNYEVEAYSDPNEALERVKRDEFDIVILDLMLPSMDGFDLGRRIKESKDMPIIISSARGDIGNKIMGYELGVDDYLAKPYEPRELVLRIEAVLKRFKKSEDETIKYKDLEVDLKKISVKVDGYEVDLTKVEFDLLLHLIKHKGFVISREQLAGVASLSLDTKNRAVDMHISNLRYKIGDDPKTPKYIKSVWGIGYKFL